MNIERRIDFIDYPRGISIHSVFLFTLSPVSLRSSSRKALNFANKTALFALEPTLRCAFQNLPKLNVQRVMKVVAPWDRRFPKSLPIFRKAVSL
jgi:hypothetical protein